MLNEFYKLNENDDVWFVNDDIGPVLFSFDKKTIYNFWTDWDTLNNEQKEIFRKANPIIAGLKL